MVDFKINMKKLIVLDLVCLTNNHLRQISLPNISKIIENGFTAPMEPSFPAVTCSVQASITSGFYPSQHGIIANGLYDRKKNQVSFWEQYASLVEKPRIWDVLKKNDPEIKTAVLFWQNSLQINSDVVITPKPIHLENQMIMWCYSKPVNFYENISSEEGDFDLKWYWGPLASIKSSQWIIKAAKHTIKKQKPHLVQIYLPHLDYAAQKHGPHSEQFKKSLFELDSVVGELLDFLESENLNYDYEIMLISEYGFMEVNHSISPNLTLLQEGLLSTRKISGRNYLDFEHSKAFAMVDHQIAHVYVKSGYEDKVSSIFKKIEGIEKILDKNTKKDFRIDHPNSGELILCANDNSWLNYYWWDEPKYAPPFSFTIDIHRKPGYDPLELFYDPSTNSISQNTSLIKGSHGLVQNKETDNLPIFALTGTKKEIRSIDISQIAPSISKFFRISNNFPSAPIF